MSDTNRFSWPKSRIDEPGPVMSRWMPASQASLRTVAGSRVGPTWVTPRASARSTIVSNGTVAISLVFDRPPVSLPLAAAEASWVSASAQRWSRVRRRAVERRLVHDAVERGADDRSGLGVEQPVDAGHPVGLVGDLDVAAGSLSVGEVGIAVGVGAGPPVLDGGLHRRQREVGDRVDDLGVERFAAGGADRSGRLIGRQIAGRHGVGEFVGVGHRLAQFGGAAVRAGRGAGLLAQPLGRVPGPGADERAGSIGGVGQPGDLRLEPGLRELEALQLRPQHRRVTVIDARFATSSTATEVAVTASARSMPRV